VVRFLKEQPVGVLSAGTRQRLREYMHQSRHIMIDAANKRLIESMSPALQGEVAYKCNQAWLTRVPFLRGAEPAFMVALALELTPMVFAPAEEPMAGYLYIVHRGLALHAGRVLSAGKVCGARVLVLAVPDAPTHPTIRPSDHLATRPPDHPTIRPPGHPAGVGRGYDPHVTRTALQLLSQVDELRVASILTRARAPPEPSVIRRG